MPRTRLIGATGLVLAALGVVAGCGGGTPAASPTVVAVGATEFAFDPAAITATAGSSVTITLKNNGTVEHDMLIDALGKSIPVVKVGQTGELTLTDVAAGTYQFWCTVAGHKEAGMTGTLEVK